MNPLPPASFAGGLLSHLDMFLLAGKALHTPISRAAQTAFLDSQHHEGRQVQTVVVFRREVEDACSTDYALSPSMQP